MHKLISIGFLAAMILLLTSCFSSKMNEWTSPPPRTIPLDSVKVQIDPFRFKPEPDSFLVQFTVPGKNDCHVKIDFLNSAHEVERYLIDSTYSPGSYKFFWPRLASGFKEVLKLHAYYYNITICDSSFTRSFYYREELNK